MNFERVANFNFGHIAGEIQKAPCWNWLNLRRVKGLMHNDVEDIVLRFQSLEGKHDPAYYMEHLDCVDYVVQQQFPLTMTLAAWLSKGRPIGRVMIAKLKSHGIIGAHIDEGEYAKQHDRYHCVVATNKDVVFTCNGEICHMAAGDIWWLDNKSTHSVANHGDTDRIHIIIDIRKA